jgi:hypothetical protein
MRRIFFFFVIFCFSISVGLLPSGIYSQQKNQWEIMPSLKCDAFSFLNAVSKESFYNRMYARDLEIWKGRLGANVMDSINAILDTTGGIGFKGSYLISYLPAGSLDDIIGIFSDSAECMNKLNGILTSANDFRYVSSIKDLKNILTLRSKLIYVFRRMKESGWDDDWKSIECRIRNDIKLKEGLLNKYSPVYLRSQVDDFLKIEVTQRDSSSRIYYLYYAFPNGFKLPYNMMATWNIEYPMYFFSVYMHERLHSFSIYTDGMKEYHDNFILNSAEFKKHRQIMTEQLYESDEEFYILAAEAYLSVKTGIRTKIEAEDYLKNADGGTAILSLMIFRYLDREYKPEMSYGSFLKNIFFKNVSAADLDKFIIENK